MSAATAVLSMAAALPRWFALSPLPAPGVRVPDDFLGVHAAGSPDPAAEDAVLARLAGLPLRRVKVDLDPSRPSPHTLRFLARLNAGGYRVLLRITPAPAEAAVLHRDPAAMKRWRDGLEALPALDGWPAVEAVEVGATVNRRRWSGFSPASFAAAWGAAAGVLRAAGIPLAGPNVSDFEPLHLISALSSMRAHGGPPDVATVNLFAERTRTPEAFDARAAGRWMAPLLRLNLVKKARIFRDIAARGGASSLWSTHCCWHRFRLERWSSDPEMLRAAYLSRYLLCAAASGALGRVYWGTLVGCPEGLVDDGSGPQPGLERVAFYDRSQGDPAQWRDLPALGTLRFMGEQLPGSVLLSWLESADGSVYSTWHHPQRGPWYAAWNARDVESPAPATTGPVWDACGLEFPNAPKKLGPLPMIWESQR